MLLRYTLQAFPHLWSTTTACGTVSRGRPQMFPLTHLFISRLDPISIESMAPESTPTIIVGVGLAAVNTPSRMGARSTLGSRANRRGLTHRTSFAATSKGTMVFLAMRSRADGTLNLRPPAHSGGMTPLPAPLTERRAQVCPGSPKHSNEPSKLDRPPDERLSACAANQISNVHIDGRRIRCCQVTDNPEGALKHNEVFDPSMSNVSENTIRHDGWPCRS
jgi:hypothetical protein